MFIHYTGEECGYINILLSLVFRLHCCISVAYISLFWAEMLFPRLCSPWSLAVCTVTPGNARHLGTNTMDGWQLRVYGRTSPAPTRLWPPPRGAVVTCTLPCLLPARALNPGRALFVSSNAANEVAMNFFVVYSMRDFQTRPSLGLFCFSRFC